MHKFVINLCVVLCVALCAFNFGNADNMINNSGPYVQDKKLKNLNISDDSLLNKILNDWETTSDTTLRGDSYSLIMSEYKKGRIIKIITYKEPDADSDYHYNGYILQNGKRIFSSIFYPKYDTRQNTITIKTEKKDTSDIIDIRYYYILDDIYAKFNHDRGWIWSDGKPDE